MTTPPLAKVLVRVGYGERVECDVYHLHTMGSAMWRKVLDRRARDRCVGAPHTRLARGLPHRGVLHNTVDLSAYRTSWQEDRAAARRDLGIAEDAGGCAQELRVLMDDPAG